MLLTNILMVLAGTACIIAYYWMGDAYGSYCSHFSPMNTGGPPALNGNQGVLEGHGKIATGGRIISAFEEPIANGNHDEITNEGSSIIQNRSPTASPTPTPPCSHRRYHFFDNLKTFLTATVVNVLIAISFGDDTQWYLRIGEDDESSSGITKYTSMQVFALLHQGFFMTLFFFILGFFAVSAYDRKEISEFVRSKVNRLLCPLLYLCSYTVYPLTYVISRVAITDDDDSPILYFPHIGVTWYLYWLFTFCLAYSTFSSSAVTIQMGGTIMIMRKNRTLYQSKIRFLVSRRNCCVEFLFAALECFSYGS